MPFAPAVRKSAQDGVGGRVAEQVSEDEPRRRPAVIPHRQPGLDVGAVDLPAAVEQCVDQRQP